MSITNFLNKIKGLKKISNFTYFYIFILIFVAISAFLLGTLSQNDKVLIGNNNSVKEFNPAQKEDEIEISIQKKMYLASKNGKMYYTVGCPGANRIAEKNIVYFNNSTEAELAGYQFSATCNK